MTTLGAVCLPQLPPEQLRNVAVAAQAAGLDELWLWEDCFWGGAVPAGRGDAHRLVVHLAVVGRDAVHTAAAVRGLAEAGADTVILQPSPEQADLDHFERFVRFAAEQVRPLL